jgi:hypothetical protein
MEQPERRTGEQIVRVTESPPDGQPDTRSSAASRDEVGLAGPLESFVAVNVAGDQGERLPRRLEGRDERALHVDFVGSDRAVGVRRMVNEDDRPADGRIRVQP